MADWYCDNTNGNDTTGSGTSGSPYQTLQKCIDSATRGDNIYIANTSAQVLSSAITWTTYNSTGTGVTSFKPWDNGGSLTLTVPGTGAITSATIDASALAVDWMGTDPGNFSFHDLLISSSTRFDGGVSAGNTMSFFRCYFLANRSNGYHVQSALAMIGCTFETQGVQNFQRIHGCFFKDINSYAFHWGSTPCSVYANLVLGNTGYTGTDPLSTTAQNSVIINNTFISPSARTGPALQLAHANSAGSVIAGNVFQGFNGVGASGIDCASYQVILSGNHFYDCTSNIVNNSNAEDVVPSVTTTSAPYTDAGTNQWEASSELESSGYVTGFMGSSTQLYKDAGAIEYLSTGTGSTNVAAAKFTRLE